MIHPDIERVALLGWHLYPCSTKNRKACIKNPTWAASCDLDQIEKWSREFRRCNWRVVFGPSKLFGLDCDVPPGHPHDGVANLKVLVGQHGDLPPRPTMRSGGGGIGLFFKHNGEKIIGDTGHPAPGIDPRRGPQSQVIPPSIHITTHNPYRWLIAPWETSPPSAPAWLLDLVKPPPEPTHRRPPCDTSDAARRRLYNAAAKVASADVGRRNDTLNRQSYFVGRLIGAGLVGEVEAIEQLYGAARSVGQDHSEAAATIKSGIRSGMRVPWTESRP